VFDLCTGGDLSQLLMRNGPRKYLLEDHAKVLIRQLVSAVAHIHSRGICHRDIKMQNILLENMDNQHAQVKLIDFGFATRYVGVTPMKTRCGTPYTTAPEVFRECYDERCDVWSVGVVSYFLLSGQRPFASVELPGELKKAGRQSIVTSILMGRYHFNHPAFRQVSQEGILFIQKLLAPKYTSRWQAIDAVKCPWLSDKFVKTSLFDLSTLKSVNTPLSLAVSNLRGKRDASVLGNTGMVAVAFDHSRYDAPEIRTLFQYFDKENAGFLSKKAFKKAMKSVSPDLTSMEIDSLFEAIDVDDDKQISFTEFLAATMDPREVDTEELGKAFQLLDSDNKGYLTVDDFYRVLAVSPDRGSSLQLTAVVKIRTEEDGSKSNGEGSGNNELSSSGMPYFDETGQQGHDKHTLLRKIAQMIKAGDVNNDGVLSYSEFLLGIAGIEHASDIHMLSAPPDVAKTQCEKARVELLCGPGDPFAADTKPFFPRSFTPKNTHRKTVPSPSVSDNLIDTPITQSLPTSPSTPNTRKRGFSLSNLRGIHKTVPTDDPDPPPGEPHGDGRPTPAPAKPADAYLEIGGVSGFFSQEDVPGPRPSPLSVSARLQAGQGQGQGQTDPSGEQTGRDREETIAPSPPQVGMRYRRVCVYALY
jgi:calcium-dependent protein kinase